jgi:hypothetical protein
LRTAGRIASGSGEIEGVPRIVRAVVENGLGRKVPSVVVDHRLCSRAHHS